MSRKFFVVGLFMVLVSMVFCFYGTSNAAPVCSQNMFEKVGSNRETVTVFSGEKAKNLIQKLDSRANHDWQHTAVKAVAGGRPGFVHLLVVENNCVVSIISRTMEIYQAAVPKP